MKTYLLTFVILIMLCVTALADDITLTNPENLSSPTASGLKWWLSHFDNEYLEVTYVWKDASGRLVFFAGSYEHKWVCRDSATSTCFTDVYLKAIPAGVVGQLFGPAFRSFLFNKFKSAVLTPGNDGTFDDGH